MDNKEQIIEECKNLFAKGQTRDDIDNFLKKKNLTPKEIAAIDYQLQEIYLEQVNNKILMDKALSNIVAGYLLYIICAIFGGYTIYTKAYWSLIICFIMVSMGFKFISKGKELKNSIN